MNGLTQVGLFFVTYRLLNRNTNMSFGVYTRVDKTNRNLLRNKSRYAKTKQNAYDIQRKLKLEYPTYSPEELRKIRKKIWADIRKDQKRRRLIIYISIACGLAVATWFIYTFQYKLL